MEKKQASKSAAGYVVAGIGAVFVLLALYGLITLNLAALIFWGIVGIALLLIGIQRIRRDSSRT